MALNEAQRLLPAFKSSVQNGSGDLAPARDMLGQLKLLMTDFPSQAAADVHASPTEEEAGVSRDILEYAAILANRLGDMRAFERAVAQLRQYYTLAKQKESPAATDARQHIMGLFLMHLLVEARLAEFHSQVELLAEADRASRYITFPLRLDNLLMEGSYNKVLSARGELPSPLFAPYMDKLAGTVRDDIADCAAAAYPSLSLAEAQRMLALASPADVAAYASGRGLNWSVTPAGVHFVPVERKGTEPLDALAVMKNALAYATDIERIV